MGGRAAALRCGDRPFGPIPLRCSCPGGERRTRPRMAGISLTRAAYARCSGRLRSTHRLEAMRNPRAPALLGAAEALRRSPAHGLAGTTEQRDEEPDPTRRRELRRRFSQRCGWAAGAAPLRRRAAQRSAVGAVLRDDGDVSEGPYPGPSCRRRPAELRWRPMGNSACALLPAGTGGPPARPAQGSRPAGTVAAAKQRTPSARTSATLGLDARPGVPHAMRSCHATRRRVAARSARSIASAMKPMQMMPT